MVEAALLGRRGLFVHLVRNHEGHRVVVQLALFHYLDLTTSA
jgi:hypothetical protein